MSARTMEVQLILKDQLSSALATPAKAVENLSASAANAGKGAASGFSAMTSAASGVGSSLTNLASRALGAGSAIGASIGVAAVNAFSEFEQVMSGTQAVSGATASEMQKLSDLAIQFGKDTAFSAKESALALQELIKAGVSIPDIMSGAASATLDLAAAGELGLPEAASIASAAMNSFSLSGEQMGHVSNLIAGAANASAIDVADFGQSIKAVGPTASTVGANLDDTAVAIALMGKVGIKGSESGNSLKTALLSLASPSKAAADTMNALGISAFDAEGKLKPLPQVAQELQNATKGLTQEAKTAALSDIFGTFGLSAGVTLAKEGAAGFTEMATAMGKVSAADVAATKLDNLAGSTQQLSGSVETFLILLGKGLVPLVRLVVDSLTGAVNAALPLASAFSSLPEPVRGLIAAFVAVAGASTLLGGAASLLPAPLAAIATGAAGLLAPLAPLIALVVGLGLAFKTNFLGIRDALQPVVVAVQTGLATIGVAWQTFMAAFQGGSAEGPFSGLVLGLDALQQRFPMLTPVITIFGSALALAQSAVSGLVGLFAPLFPLLAQAQISFAFLGAAINHVLGGDLTGAVSMASMAFTNLGTAIMTALMGLATNLLTIGLQLAQSLVSWVITAAPMVLAGLNTLVTGLITTVMTVAPQLAMAALSWGASLLSWIGQTAITMIPQLIGLVTTLATWVASQVPVVVGMFLGWATAFGSWVIGAIAQLSSQLPGLVSSLFAWASAQVPGLIANLLSWATALVSWIPTAIGYLGQNLGMVVGTILSFIVSNGPSILASVLNWAVSIGNFALQAIPFVVSSLVQFIGAVIGWIFSTGLPMLLSAAASLAGGLVKGFIGALTGQTGAASSAGAKFGAAAPNAAANAAASPWDRLISGFRSKAATADAQAEQGFMKGQARQGALNMMQQAQAGINAGAPGLKAAAGAAGAGAAGALNAGMGKGGGGGGAGGGGGGGGGGGAGQNPVDTAMQSISSVAQAVSSGIDAMEKMFKFRGPPPEQLMKQVFDGLRSMLKMGMKLASGLTAESAQLGQAVAQMLSGFISAFTGMVELGDKLARFRVPTPDSLSSLLNLAKSIMAMSKQLTQMFGSGDLQKSLEEATVSGKVAETLKSWSETLKAIAEATDAIAKGRWDVSLDPVFAFVSRLAGFVMQITLALKQQLGDQLRIAIMDATDVANMLKPWADLIKSIAESTLALAKARWPANLSGPQQFISQLAQMALGTLKALQQQLGPALLLALDDSKLVAEVLQSWMEPLAKMGEVTISLSKMRPVSLAPVGSWITSLFVETIRIQQDLKSRLGPAILVALADSKMIAETLNAWLEPLGKVGAVALAIDTVRALAQRRFDPTMQQLSSFLVDVLLMASRFLSGAYKYAGSQLLVTAEDSKVIADTLTAWLAPLEKVGAAALSIDTVRALAQRRFDPTMTQVVKFLTDLAIMASVFVAGAVKYAGDKLLKTAEDSKAIADSFLAWLAPFEKIGAAAVSIDVMRGLAQRRWDTTFADVQTFLTDLAGRFAPIVAAASRAADPGEAQKMSQTVAQTFGAWMDMFAKVGAASESIRRMKPPDPTVFERGAVFAMSIATRFAPIVAAVARAANPDEQQKLSQTVATTFGVWLDMFAKVGPASESMTRIKMPTPEQVLAGGTMLMSIANRFAPIVAAVARAANADEGQKLSQLVAQTFGAWIDAFAKAADMSRKLVGIEPVRPEELDRVTAVVESAWQAGLRLADSLIHMDDLIRDNLVTGAKAFFELASGALSMFQAAAGLDLSKLVPVDPAQLARAEGGIKLAMASLRRMALDFMPELKADMDQLVGQMKGYLDVAAPALSLFTAGAKLGADTEDAVMVQASALAAVRRSVALVVALVGSLANDWAAAQSRMTESNLKMKGFSDAARAALDVIKPAVDAMTALASDDLKAASVSALSKVRITIALVMRMVEGLAAGYLTAKGELDTARTTAISGFSTAVKDSVGATKDVVDLMVKLSDSQGQLGGLTATAQAQISSGIQALIGLMSSLAAQYNIADREARKSLERSAGFAKTISELAKPLSDVVKVLDDIWHFAFKEVSGGEGKATKLEPIVRDYGAHVRQSLVTGIELVVSVLSQVADDLGPYALAQASWVAGKVAPVAQAIGSMLEPINKLMTNPFVDTKTRSSSVMKNAAQTRISQLALNVSKGIQKMVEALVRGLSGVKIPAGIDAGVARLTSVMSGLLDIITKAMQAPPIDMKQIQSVVAAAALLSSIGLPMGGAGGAGGIGMPAMPPISMPPMPIGATLPGGGATTPVQPPATNGGGQTLITGPVQAVGPVQVTGDTEVTVKVEGRTIEKTSRTGSFRRGQSKDQATRSNI